MSFLRVEGYELDVMVEDFSITDASIEGFSRTLSDSYEGLTYARKKQISFGTPPMSEADCIALEGWIRGLYHSWSFERPGGGTTRFTLASSDAGLSLSAGSLASQSLYGSWALRLATAATSCATTTFGSEGDWTVFGYHRASTATYAPFAARSKSGTIDAWLGGATVATLRFLTVTAASGYLTPMLIGRISTGSFSIVHYDALRIAPFALTDGMIGALNSAYQYVPTSGPGRAPFVIVSGTALPQGGPTTITESGERVWTAKGFAGSIDTMPAVVDGVRENARSLRVTLIQK